MTHDEMIAVIRAHKEGKIIQFRVHGREAAGWINTGDNHPYWDFASSFFYEDRRQAESAARIPERLTRVVRFVEGMTMNDKSRPPLPKPVVFDPGRFGVAYSGEQMYEMFDLGWEMALKRLEQSAAQEPVAWLKDDGSDAWTAGKKSRAIESAGIGGANLAAQYNRPLYAAPVAQAQGPVAPNGYAYRYPDGIRFNDGH